MTGKINWESRMISIILNWKNQLLFWSKSFEQSSSYIVIWENYIRWLIISTDWLRPTQISNFLSIFYNIITPHVQIYHALKFLWQDDDGPTVSGVTQHFPYGFERPKCVCEQVKFPKYVCLVAQLGEKLLEKQIMKFILNILW